MGPWEVTGNITAILVAVVVVAATIGAVVVARARRRRREAADRLGDEEVLRAQVLERLRDVQVQWDEKSEAIPTRVEPVAPRGLPSATAAADHPASRAGPAHGERRARGGGAHVVGRVVVVVLVLAVLVGAVVIWTVVL